MDHYRPRIRVNVSGRRLFAASDEKYWIVCICVFLRMMVLTTSYLSSTHAPSTTFDSGFGRFFRV